MEPNVKGGSCLTACHCFTYGHSADVALFCTFLLLADAFLCLCFL